LLHRRYDKALMEAYGLGDCLDLLPRLIESADIAGHGDEEVASQTGLARRHARGRRAVRCRRLGVGSGVTRTGSASIIAGTWSINQVIIDGPDLDGPVFMSSTFDRSRYMAIESAPPRPPISNGWSEFFPKASMLKAVSPFDAALRACRRHRAGGRRSDLSSVLYGAQQDGHARAGFYGIAGWHTKGHLVRALLEGVAFGHRAHIETMRKAGAVFNEAVLSGGGSRSLIWPQIFADVLGVPVSWRARAKPGALGAAIAAGTGVGIFADFEAGAAAMVQTERHYRPNVSLEAHYARRYALYNDIAEAMAPIWRRLTAVQPVVAGVAA
jgi:L-xylulokinase